MRTALPLVNLVVLGRAEPSASWQDEAVIGCKSGWRMRNVPLPEPHLLGIAVGMGLQRVCPVPLPGPRAAQRVLGWSLVAAGGWIVVRSLREAQRVHLAHPDRLVTTGPYAASRNPMYAGWALLHVGAAAAAGSGWLVATLPPAAAWIHRTVLAEERMLGDRFGPEFDRYRAAVPRYLPRGGRHSV